jgi:hypothetical protein
MFWGSVFWLFWIMWFFPRKYKYRCIRVYVWFKDDKHVIWMWMNFSFNGDILFFCFITNIKVGNMIHRFCLPMTFRFRKHKGHDLAYDVKMYDVSAEPELIKKWMVYLQTTYELCFGETYFEYFESCDFSRENTNIDLDVYVFMFDLRMINMSSEWRPESQLISICYLDVNWLIPKISACRARIWSLAASERSERVTSFIFCRAGWYFSHVSDIIQYKPWTNWHASVHK